MPRGMEGRRRMPLPGRRPLFRRFQPMDIQHYNSTLFLLSNALKRLFFRIRIYMAFLKSLRHADTGDSPRSDISLPSSPGILTHFLHIFAVS